MVVSFDNHFSYSKVIKACSYAQNLDNLFIVTGEDSALPTDSKQIVIPGEWLVCGVGVGCGV